MTNSSERDLTAMLADGWAVAGYSTCPSKNGQITHHVLLQKGSELATRMVPPAPSKGSVWDAIS